MDDSVDALALPVLEFLQVRVRVRQPQRRRRASGGRERRKKKSSQLRRSRRETEGGRAVRDNGTAARCIDPAPK